MAVYTFLDKRHLSQLADDYGLGKLQAANGVAAGSVNTHYRLDAAKGRYFLKIDEVKSEIEVKREIDLLLYLRKHGFPCPQLIVDRKGRQYRELGGKCLSLYKFIDGHSRQAQDLTLGQIENAGRVLADLHTIGKSYKKGIENIEALFGSGSSSQMLLFMYVVSSMAVLALTQADTLPSVLSRSMSTRLDKITPNAIYLR